MCELQDEIKKLIVKNININDFDKEWKEWNDLDALPKIKNITIIERKNIQGSRYDEENKKSIDYKFMEYTKWKSKNVKQCVAIGFNPAKINPNEIDSTNKKLITELNNMDYNSYILLNLYPQVSTNKNTFNETDTIDEKFQNILLEILSLLIDQAIDTIIFWGRTVSISNEIYSKLIKLQEKNHLFMTIKKGDKKQHCHPAYIQIQIIKVSNDNYLVTTHKLLGEQ